MDKILLAVYGTLRKGLGNHTYLSDQDFIGFGWTKDEFCMKANGIPFVYKWDGEDPFTKIRVEVYDVDIDRLVTYVDVLEGHPDVYCRKPVSVKMDSGTFIDPWLYLYTSNISNPFKHIFKKAECVKDGDYLSYVEEKTRPRIILPY